MVYVYLAKPEKQVFKVQIKYKKLSWENSLACLNLQKNADLFLKFLTWRKKFSVFFLMSGNLEPQASAVILNDKRKKTYFRSHLCIWI